jgi:hypothetical protein
LKGQDTGIPSDLVFRWRGAAHQEGDVSQRDDGQVNWATEIAFAVR